MVETPPSKPELAAAEDLRKNPEHPVASPRKKIRKSEKPLRNRAKVVGHARQKSSDLSHQAVTMVSSAARGLRPRSHTVSEVARENPGTTTSVLGVVGVLGFLFGVLVGRALTDNTRHKWY
jgi:hypothetical protein